MKIAVLMKPILDCGVHLSVDDKSLAVVQKDQRPCWITNPVDRTALEAALAIKERERTVQVTAVSYVHPDRAEAVCHAMARGADRAVMIEDEKESEKDAATVSAALSRFLARERVDLVLCGNRSMDSGMACVGPFIAEHLGIPQVTGAVEIAILNQNKTIMVHRRLDKGNREVIEADLPAVVTVDGMLVQPRYVSAYALMAARKRSIERITLESLGMEKTGSVRMRLIKVEPPRPRPKRTFTPDVRLSAAERMKMIRSGGMARKTETEALTGTPESIAEGIVAFLQDKGMLKRE